MSRPGPRRRGASFLELQVAMLVFCVALAGVCPLVAMQSRLLRRIENQGPGTSNAQLIPGVRTLDGTPMSTPTAVVLQPQPDAWVRRLGTAATFRADAPAQSFTPMAVQLQVDDGDPAFSARGWSTATDPTAVDGSYHFMVKGGTGPASWSLSGINAGAYHVLVSWVANPSNATDATYQITIGTTVAGTFTADQTAPPGGTPAGASWRDSGLSLYLDPRYSIALGPSNKGRAVADAVLLVPSGPLNGVTVRVPAAATPDGAGAQVSVTVGPP